MLGRPPTPEEMEDFLDGDEVIADGDNAKASDEDVKNAQIEIPKTYSIGDLFSSIGNT